MSFPFAICRRLVQFEALLDEILRSYLMITNADNHKIVRVFNVARLLHFCFICLWQCSGLNLLA